MAQPKPVKVCTLGESGAGKSSLIMRLTTGNFSSNQQTTIGAAFVAWTSPDGKTRLEIWDTAGQERYATLAPMYYRNAAGILVVYDMTERASFERAIRWLTELPSTMPADTVLILVANKSDLAESREVTEEEGREAAEQHKCARYAETSAKSSDGIQEVFEFLCDQVQTTEAPPAHERIVMQPAAPQQQKSACC